MKQEGGYADMLGSVMRMNGGYVNGDAARGRVGRGGFVEKVVEGRDERERNPRPRHVPQFFQPKFKSEFEISRNRENLFAFSHFSLSSSNSFVWISLNLFLS